MRVLVIGASGTIGSAVVTALRAKHEVLEASRKGPLKIDITDSKSIQALYREVGKVDAVVSCAGGATMKPLQALSDGDFNDTLNDKLMGQVNLVRLGLDSDNLN